MKKMFALVLALLMMLCAAGAMAETCPGYKAITNETELDDFFKNGGNGCLQDNITCSAMGDDTQIVCHLCLHGYELNGAIDLEDGFELHLYDNVDGGELVHDNATVVRVEEGTFVLHSGTVRSEAEGEEAGGTEDGVVQVSPDCTFEMLGGKIEGFSGLVVNYGKTSISGGELTASNGIGVTNYESGRLEISGEISASNGMGVMNAGDLEISGGSIHGDMVGVLMLHGEVEPSLTIKKGEISNTLEELEGIPLTAVMTVGDAEDFYVPLDDEGCIADGSLIVEGGFDQNYVKVDLISALSGAAGGLPQTGDASMLGAWVCLLGAAGMGLKLKKKH